MAPSLAENVTAKASVVVPLDRATHPLPRLVHDRVVKEWVRLRGHVQLGNVDALAHDVKVHLGNAQTRANTDYDSCEETRSLISFAGINVKEETVWFAGMTVAPFVPANGL